MIISISTKILRFFTHATRRNQNSYQKKISYSHRFEKYIKGFLQEFDFDEVDKFDLHTYKKTKYIS